MSPPNFKEFERSGYCDGLRLRSLASSVAMQKEPNLDTVNAAEYDMKRYFDLYFLEIREWLVVQGLKDKGAI